MKFVAYYNDLCSYNIISLHNDIIQDCVAVILIKLKEPRQRGNFDNYFVLKFKIHLFKWCFRGRLVRSIKEIEQLYIP